MANKKNQDSSWKNVADHRKGKARLVNGILQHPDEEAGDKSIYNFLKGKVKREKKMWLLPWKQFERLGKTNEHNQRIEEDMIGPGDSPSYNPGPIHQTPQSIPADMDQMSLLGPGKRKDKLKTNKDTKKSKKKKNEGSNPAAKTKKKILAFGDYIKNKGKKSNS